jgi:exosortase H (IPTLxxWG-CTERM-specific)
MAKQRRSSAKAEAPPPADPERPEIPLWRRPEARFLAGFLLVLAGSFLLLSWRPVNDGVVEPFTAGVARASGVALRLVGEDVVRTGTILRSPSFAVNIRNGCNGVEAMVILLAAIVAYPAPWRARAIGLALGIVVIQLVNLVRVVALFLTGAYMPRFFDSSHTLVWQTVVILVALLVWVFWAKRFAHALPAPAAAE